MSLDNFENRTPIADRIWKRRVIGWSVSLCIIGPLAVLVFTPPRATSREEAYANSCRQNLKEIMLALHNYHDVYASFPPAYTVDANGKRLHSWRTLLLPYLREEDLYAQLRLDEPWDSEHNQAVRGHRLPTISHWCPSDPTWFSDVAKTNYLAVVGTDTMWPGTDSRTLDEVTDGTFNTIMLVELVDSRINFFEPRDLSFDEMSFLINDPERPSPGSRHQTETTWPWQTGEPYVHVAFVDGSVKALPQSTPPETLRALLTINGGETTEPIP